MGGLRGEAARRRRKDASTVNGERKAEARFASPPGRLSVDKGTSH